MQLFAYIIVLYEVTIILLCVVNNSSLHSNRFKYSVLVLIALVGESIATTNVNEIPQFILRKVYTDRLMLA